MGPTIVDVSTVPQFMAAVKGMPVAAPIFVLFLANLDLQTGNSWCPGELPARLLWLSCIGVQDVIMQLAPLPCLHSAHY